MSTIEYPPVTIASTLPPSGNSKPLSYGPLDPRIHPDDMAAIAAMIRREVRAALQVLDDATEIVSLSDVFPGIETSMRELENEASA